MIKSVIAAFALITTVLGDSFPITIDNTSWEQGTNGWTVAPNVTGNPEVYNQPTPTNWLGYGTNAILLGVTKQTGVNQRWRPVQFGVTNHWTVRVYGEHAPAGGRPVRIRLRQEVPQGMPPQSGVMSTLDFRVGKGQTITTNIYWFSSNTNGLPWVEASVYSGCVIVDSPENPGVIYSPQLRLAPTTRRRNTRSER